MKPLLFSSLLAGLAVAVPPAPPSLPKPVPFQRPAEIVCDTAQDGEPFCTVFYPSGEYCTTYRSGEQQGPNCGD